jgi:NAD(P)-dependent dehydrogenase (short-subunit alcohol dehydrogenase family)
VAIVTGAGRGLGRAHALALAHDGVAVVVNDLGGDVHGQGADLTPAAAVCAEIEASGGRAVVSGHDVADWQQAGDMVDLAVRTFGALHVLVNNAGILRDRTLANLSEGEWDAVVRVHLKGHAAPTHHAMAYWRERAEAGEKTQASVIHTTSLAGLIGNIGQANYGSAKMAVVGLSHVTAMEGARYGVRSNAVSPAARTRITASVLSSDPIPESWDEFDPRNVSPLIAYLARADCPANDQVFHIYGSRVFVLRAPGIAKELTSTGPWTADALAEALPANLVQPLRLEEFIHS